MPKLDNKTKKAQVQEEESSSEEEEVTTKKVKTNVPTKAAPAKGKAPAKKVESSDEESEEEVIKPQQKGKVAQKAVAKADQKNKKVAESDSDTSSDEDLKKPAAKKATVTTTAKAGAKAPAKKVVESEEDSDEEEPQPPKKKAAAPAPAAKGKKPVAKEESSEESEEEVKPVKKAAPAKPAAKKADIDDEVSDSDEAPKGKTATKAPVKAPVKAAAKKVVEESSEEEESEEEVKPKAKAVAQKAAATTKAPVKAAAKKVEESSEEESEDETPKGKTATKAPVKAQPAKAAAKKVESEEEEEEEEEEPVKTKTAPVTTQKPAFGGFNKQEATGAAKTGHSHEVIVKGLPFAASENDVAEFFSGCAGYESVNLLKGPDGRSKGIAFARFSTEEGVTQAVALSNSDMGGRYIVVEKTTPKDQRPAGGAGVGAKGAQDFGQKTQRDPNSSSIFIGNLSYQTTEDSLRRFFEGCGEIYGLRIAMDQETGRPRGFAHVDFTSPDAVDKAVALAGTELDGRAIRVDFSAGKKQGGQGGFGGQGGYGGGGFGGRGGRAPGQGQRMNLSEGDAAKKKGSISSFAGQKQRL